MKILILGGTSFHGPHQIACALDRGYEITIFTRGKIKATIHTKLFSDVEHLIGDRENNLKALFNRKWDAVIDNSGHKTEWTQRLQHYLNQMLSSISILHPPVYIIPI